MSFSTAFHFSVEDRQGNLISDNCFLRVVGSEIGKKLWLYIFNSKVQAEFTSILILFNQNQRIDGKGTIIFKCVSKGS